MFKVKCIDNEYAEDIFVIGQIYDAENKDKEHYYIKDIGCYHKERFKKLKREYVNEYTNSN